MSTTTSTAAATTPAPASKPPELKQTQASTSGILDVLLHSRSKSEPMLRSTSASPTNSDHARTTHTPPPPPPSTSSNGTNNSASLIPTPLADAATSSALGTQSTQSSQPTASIIKHYPTSSTPKKPDEKINFACTCCRRAHKACDGFRPCGRCVRLGLEEQCRNSVRKKRGSLSVNKKSMWRKLITQQGNSNTPSSSSSSSVPASPSPSPTHSGETPNQTSSTSTTPLMAQAEKVKPASHLACSQGARPHEKKTATQLSAASTASVTSSSTAPSTKSNSGCSTDPKRLPSIQEIFGAHSATVPTHPAPQTYYPFWLSASSSFFSHQQQTQTQQQPAATSVRSVLDFSRQSTPFFSFANPVPPKTTENDETKTMTTSRVSAP